MQKRVSDWARAAVGAVAGFFATVFEALRGWVMGGDLTVIVVLVVVAVVLLFALIPNYRRY